MHMSVRHTLNTNHNDLLLLIPAASVAKWSFLPCALLGMFIPDTHYTAFQDGAIYSIIDIITESNNRIQTSAYASRIPDHLKVNLIFTSLFLFGMIISRTKRCNSNERSCLRSSRIFLLVYQILSNLNYFPKHLNTAIFICISIWQIISQKITSGSGHI